MRVRWIAGPIWQKSVGDLATGEVYDLPAEIAKVHIARGRAEVAEKGESKKTTTAPKKESD